MKQKGFSLVEVILVVGAVVLLGLLINGLASPISSINKSRHASLAKEIASRQIESLRKQIFENLSYGANPFYDANLSTLPSSQAVYEVAECPIEVCALEEERESVKQIKVKVSWNESGQVKEVELLTLIGEGGIGQ